jgi:hypothetical protein
MWQFFCVVLTETGRTADHILRWLAKEMIVSHYRVCAKEADEKCVYEILFGKPKGKIPLGRPRCRWENNIKIDVKEVRMHEVLRAD